MSGKLLILLCSLLSVNLYGQGFSVSADKFNVAYIGIDNPLTILVEGYSCNQLEVSCANVKLAKTEGCTFMFRPIKEGLVDIYVKVKTSSEIKEIGIKKFRVKLLPAPQASIAGKSSGMLQAAIFKVQFGIVAPLINLDINATYKIINFRIELFRDSNLLYAGQNTGGAFNDNILNQIKNLKPGDKVYITNINAKGSDSRVQHLNDIDIILN